MVPPSRHVPHPRVVAGAGLAGRLTAMLYRGKVMHRRHGARGYRFEYRVFSLLVDIDELPALARRLRWFAHNRFGLLSLHDRDHGARDGRALRPWAEQLLDGHGIDARDRRIRLLCFPRVLGYAFNPLSLWLLDDGPGTPLAAILGQVHNTFGDQHFYLLHGEGEPLAPVVRAAADKHMHVSPFIALAGGYRFRFDLGPRQHGPERFDYTVEQRQPDGRPLLVARHWASAEPLDDAHILRAWRQHPLMTLKVIAGIHWEALRLFLRGARFHPRPEPADQEVTRCQLI